MIRLKPKRRSGISRVQLLLMAGICGCLMVGVGCEPTVSPATWSVINAWLSCDECVEDELEAVVALGTNATLPLGTTLKGLPDDRTENLVRKAIVAWRSLRSTGVDSARFVNHHVSGFVAKTQMRSAVALAQLGEWDAVRMASDSAVAWAHRDDVEREIQDLFLDPAALPSLHHNTSLSGQVEDGGGNGIAGVNVTLLRCRSAPAATSPAEPGECDSGGILSQVVVTGASGTFSFTGLPEGVYQVSPDPDGTPFSLVSPSARLFLLIGAGDHESGDYTLST